jgi:hypothetical protein
MIGRAIKWLMRILVWIVITPFAFLAIGGLIWYFSPAETMARKYRPLLVGAILSGNVDLKKLFPDEMVCMVPESKQYVSFYAKEEMRGELVYSDGEIAGGFWYLLIKQSSTNRVWSFPINQDEIRWDGEEFICPTRIGSKIDQGIRKVVIN